MLLDGAEAIFELILNLLDLVSSLFERSDDNEDRE